MALPKKGEQRAQPVEAQPVEAQQPQPVEIDDGRLAEAQQAVATLQAEVEELTIALELEKEQSAAQATKIQELEAASQARNPGRPEPGRYYATLRFLRNPHDHSLAFHPDPNRPTQVLKMDGWTAAQIQAGLLARFE